MLNSQDEIDNFQSLYGPCDEVPINLTIQGSDISNLNGLAGLVAINGSFFISDNPILSDITGLSDLEDLRSNFSVDNNPILSSLDGLQNLSNIEGTFWVSDMQSLMHLDDLTGLLIVGGSITIRGNPLLESISGLSNASSAREVNIYDNPSLENLNGVGQFSHLETGLFIDNNDSLSNLDELSGIESLNASIRSICGNDYCTSLRIAGNDSLENLNGLSGLDWAIGSVVVENNPILDDCDGLETLLNQRDDGLQGPGPGEAGIPDVGRFVNWSNNAPGCNSLNEFIDVFELEGFENIPEQE